MMKAGHTTWGTEKDNNQSSDTRYHSPHVYQNHSVTHVIANSIIIEISNVVDVFLKPSGHAQVIATLSGSISTVWSLLIISIILRSPSKLSTVYNKIVFSLSFWDTLSSVSVAVSTLPMSKQDVLDVYMFDTVAEYIDESITLVYNFDGAVLGNARTCTAQGFAITAGQAFAMLSNVTLSVYYMSSIRFKMTDKKVRGKLLPIMIIISCVIGLPVCVMPLIMGLYNPQPFEPCTVIGSYPHLCNMKNNNSTDTNADNTAILYTNMEAGECIRGDVPVELKRFITLW